jgi:hypothetical protein
MSEQNGVETVVPAPHDNEGVETNPQQAPAVDAPKGEEVDYKSELERVTGELQKTAQDRDNYRTATIQLKQQLKDKGDENYDDDDAKNEMKMDIDKFKSDMVQDLIDSEIESSTSNRDEQDLIRFHYNNSIVKTGYSRQKIREDISTAKILANKKKYLSLAGELTAAEVSRATTTNSGSGHTIPSQPEPNQVKLSPQDQAILDRINARRTRRGEKPLTPNDIIKS